MPYYLADSEDAEINIYNVNLPYWATRAEAYAAANGRIVVYRSRYSETRAWQRRESGRFDDGTYQRVPWHADDAYPDHFVHVSVDAPGMIAYTASAEHGHLDRQTRTKPGRYLERFYPDTPLEQRQAWIKLCAYVPDTLTIATSADEIEFVYRHAECVKSCMGPDSHSGCDVGRNGETHPVRVYGDSDLALAYIGPRENAVARCIVWPAKLLYSRVYGAHRLECLLEQAGYRQGSMSGARIRRIDADQGGLLMPYIDGVSTAADTGDGYLRLGRGSINTQTTDGHTGADEYMCDHCGDAEVASEGDLCSYCEESQCCCERCNSIFFDEDQPNYCASCERNRQYCECCNSDTWDAMHWSESRGEYVCEDCARTHAESKFTCTHCGEVTREWVDFDQDEQIDRLASGDALTHCADCADLTVCHACAHRWESETPGEACPTCGIVARCPDTLPLPLETASPSDTETLTHA